MTGRQAGPDLFTGAREHDLPPRWDGSVVSWSGWEQPLQGVFICPPPPPTRCARCASQRPPVTSKGMVALSPRTTAEDLAADRVNRARLGPLAHKRPLPATVRLVAHRCPNCRHDTVWDMDRDEWWDLDPTDYTDTGSDHPDGRW